MRLQIFLGRNFHLTRFHHCAFDWFLPTAWTHRTIVTHSEYNLKMVSFTRYIFIAQRTQELVEEMPICVFLCFAIVCLCGDVCLGTAHLMMYLPKGDVPESVCIET